MKEFINKSKDVVPFDGLSEENLKDMTLKTYKKKTPKTIGAEIGKRRYIK